MGNLRTKAKISFSPTNKAWIYACLLPAFGVVPSLIVLSRDRSSQEARNVSKVSILLALIWLSIYAMLGSQSSESIQVSTELIKGTFTSGYFIACIWLMFKLYKGQNINLPWSERSTRTRE
jgi:small neutral amino acid transporter SnatA (MarC family)